MRRTIFFLTIIFGVIIFLAPKTFAAEVGAGKKILYVPIDSRPINLNQTVEVAACAGYEIIFPPEEFLGTKTSPGQPEKLWEWINENARGVDAAVISTDAMIYGSLINSRKHALSKEEILNRAKKFYDFKKNFPGLPIYAFGTIMRTPTSAGAGPEDPDYYKQYGDQIYRYTALKDKSETMKLSRREKKEFAELEKAIPAEIFSDWLERRMKNYGANEFFVDLTREKIFDYFLLGCDDSAVFSQTKLESRHLEEQGKDLGKTKFQVMAGADELGMLMISRAINEDLNHIPFVAAEYNDGTGKETVPTYSSEKVSDLIEGGILAVGGMRVPDPARADFVVAVNTNHDGKTYEVQDPENNITPRKGTKTFVRLLKKLLDAGYPVGVADITFGNGADNALLEHMRLNDWQFEIDAYGGWNTASNTTGFLIATGVLLPYMDEREKHSLLLTRYFDDLIYQANVRQIFWWKINQIPGNGNLDNLDEKKEETERIATELVTNFAGEKIKMPPGKFLRNIRVVFPWNRIFESEIYFSIDEAK